MNDEGGGGRPDVMCVGGAQIRNRPTGPGTEGPAGTEAKLFLFVFGLASVTLNPRFPFVRY